MHPKMTNEEHVVVPTRLATFEDPKTGVRTVAFPIVFPDGTKGVVAVCHLKKGPWDPNDDIEEVIIKWNKHENKTSIRPDIPKNRHA
jgi:hypothetical protein